MKDEEDKDRASMAIVEEDMEPTENENHDELDDEHYSEKEREKDDEECSPTSAPTPIPSPYPTRWSDEKGNLKFVNAVVRRPCCIFWSLLLACFVVTILLLIVLAIEGQPFTEPENESDLNHKTSIQFDSLRLAHDEVEDFRDMAQGATVIRRQSEAADITYWVFEAETPDGCFGSESSIRAMKEAFDLFIKHEQYEEYCNLMYDINEEEPYCDLPITSLTMYFPAQWDQDLVEEVLQEWRTPGSIELFNALALCYTQGLFCDDNNETLQEDVEWVLTLNAKMQSITKHWDMSGENLVPNITQATELAAYLKQIGVYKGLIDFGYDKEFGVNNLVSRYSRGVLMWGGPLGNATELTAEEKEDKDEDDFEERKDWVVDNFLDEMDDLAKDKTHKEINSYYFMGALIWDIILQILYRDSMLAIVSLVFVFIWLLINTCSWFLATVGILEIFFSIPMAWFIFTVVFQFKFFAYLNSLSIFIVAAIGADDIFIFMDAYKQSRYRNPENLVSLEARMTWVYRRTGQAMAITSATTCAAFLCTLITPLAGIRSFGIFAAFTVFTDYVLVMSLFCTAVVIYHDRYERHHCCECCCTDCSKTDPTPTEVARAALQSGEGYGHVDVVGEFFRNKVAGFILVPWHRILIAVVLLTWVALAIWQTTEMEAIQKAEEILQEDHPLQKAFTILENEFPTSDDDLALRVYYAWGIGEVDRSGVRLLYDPDDYGKPVFVDTFSFNEDCQKEMALACERLKTDKKYEGLIKQNGGVGRALCFVEEMAAYSVKGDLSDCNYTKNGGWKDENWTVPLENLGSLMDGFLREQSCNEESEIISSFYDTEIGWDGTSMRYAGISVESEELQPFSTEPEKFTRAEYDQFVALAKELESVSQACGVEEVIMTDMDQIFVFMNNQAIFVRTAGQSAILGIVISFVVLLFTTKVLHIAFLASFSIACVLVSVVGTMVLQGWDLGSTEAILIAITAGFSVDYCVHLAHAYESADGDSSARVTTAFGTIGISVLNGMITSVCAAVPLFFCQLQFFYKFAAFLCTTIAFSWIFANFGFMSALATLKIPIKKEGWRI